MAKSATIQRRLSELSHKDPAVRRKAAQKLGEYGDPIAIVPLLTALSDENVYVRRHAIAALGNMAAVAAFDMLLPLLKDKRSGVRRLTAYSLCQISKSHPAYADTTVYAIIRAIEKEKNIWFERSPFIEALAVMGPLAIRPLCIEFNSHRSTVSQECVEYALLLLEQRKGVDVPRCLLADQYLTASQNWNALEMLTQRRPRNIFTPRHLTNTQRYCEMIAADGKELAATRRGASAVLDYLSLGRASQRSMAGEANELLRMVHENRTQDEAGEMLLRGSYQNAGAQAQNRKLHDLDEPQEEQYKEQPEKLNWQWLQKLSRAIRRLFRKV